MAIQKFQTTEEIRKVYFLQLINRIKNSDHCCNLKIDLKAIEEQYVVFLKSNELNGISVNELYKVITYDTRLGEESIYNMAYDTTNFPEYLYAFKELSPFEDIYDCKHLPPLYDRIIEKSDNELVAMYLFHSLYIYNKQGVFLNLIKHPNLYDNGQIRVCFLKNNYLAIEIEDDNNGICVELYNYFENKLTFAEVSSIEMINELECHSIDWGLNNISSQLLDNKHAILAALKKSNSLNLRRYDLSYVSEKMRDDIDVAFAAVSIWEINYKYISSILQLDTELALKYIKKFPNEFEVLPKQLRTEKDFLLKAVEGQPELIDHFPEFLQTDKDLVLTAAKTDPLAFGYNISLAPQHFMQDNLMLKKLVQKNPKVLLQLEHELAKNEELLRIAIKKDVQIIKLIKGIQSDYNLAIKLTMITGEIIQYLDTLQYNPRFALECMEKNGLNLQFFPEEIRSNESVVIAAIKQNKNALIYASSSIRDRLTIEEIPKNDSSLDDLPF
jgi:hypothetical protein